MRSIGKPGVLVPTMLMAWFTLAVSGALGADPFAEGIRPTPWQTPADEQRAFHLPPGFEMQLVAAEPDIHKPMNLAFDGRGRLWVTTSTEYPIPASTNFPGRDRLMIFEDFAPDGRARKVTEFAGGLNIPIGVYPFASREPDGSTHWKAVVWSIPHIWLLEDTDGDGRADRRQVLISHFDWTRDTHGDQASFRRGFDGWLYCTHGYNNDSHVRGQDGHEVHMNSGNTYRIRLDGSRIEHYTHGQVNPFGMAFDPFGNLFASDCHSEPIYQLLAGGYYPSFGKPHDGLGFVPTMIAHKRGSTAIDGLSIGSDVLWPEEFRGNLFVGDVMTSRIYRDRVTEEGSTRTAHAMPDLVSSDDPWFRPVDTRLGPDGALYVADFYNRIIGHYEYPMNHPGRDRTSGRIWRVVYTGAPLRDPALPDTLSGLMNELNSPSLPRRMLAMDGLADLHGPKAIPDLRKSVHRTSPTEVSEERGASVAHALWLLHRMGGLEKGMLAEAARDPDRLVRVHVMRILADMKDWDEGATRELAVAGLRDGDGLVQRCAAEALANHPAFSNIVPLTDLVRRVPAEDTHLLYVARKALRDQLIPERNLEQLAHGSMSAGDRELFTPLILSVRTPAASAFLVPMLAAPDPAAVGADRRRDIVRHAAQTAPLGQMPEVVALIQGTLPNGSPEEVLRALDRQIPLFRALDEGLTGRGAELPVEARAWGSNLVTRFFSVYRPGNSWISRPTEGDPTANPWGDEVRPCADGRERRMLSSFPHGEDLTGVLRSQPFEPPPTLEFWLAGHDGFPGNPPQHLNRVRLCRHPSGAVLAEAFPPRGTNAVQVRWDLSSSAGTKVYIEATDGDDSTDYSWLAFGGFVPEIPSLQVPPFTPRQEINWLSAVAEMALRIRMKEAAPSIRGICTATNGPASREAEPDVVSAMARAWVGLDPEQAVPGLSRAADTPGASAEYRERLAQVLAQVDQTDAQGAVVSTMKTLPQKAQERLSYTLATKPFSAETLLAGMENGLIAPRVLQRVGVVNRLRVSQPAHWEERVARLKSQLPSADDARDRVIAEYCATAKEWPGNPGLGRQVFARHCAVCHRIGSEGALIGPQLDGIGQRGLNRLAEDVLDPGRNVDVAFRTVLLTLKDGEVVSGLLRGEEGGALILADGAGKEVRLPQNQVADRRETGLSLMPENFWELIPQSDFLDLMAYLLSGEPR